MVGGKIWFMKFLFQYGAGLVIALVSAGFTVAQETTSGPWVMQVSGTTAGLRGIHAVGGGVAWASGTDGTVLRTEDGGYMWQTCAMPPEGEKLDFRGIWAWDADTAMVMSSGPGGLSRIYKTTDGCSHWTLMMTNPDKDGFWDAMVFLDRQDGIVLGDPTPNRTFNAPPNTRTLAFTLLMSIDGGNTWGRDPFYPGWDIRATEGSSAFAASNSSLTTFANKAWFGTGGNGGAYVFIGDSSKTVPPNLLCDCAFMTPRFTQAVLTPLASETSSSGIFSLSFRDDFHGIAGGGDYTKPNESAGTAAWTADGGKTWTAAVKPPHGYRSAVAWDADAKAWIAAGTNGSDVSYDDGKTWAPLDSAPGGGNWNALSLPWVVGPQGRIAKLDPSKLPKN
jgi:hypothetical protein